MSDLTRMMRDAAAEPTEYPDVDRAWRRARLHRAAFVALSLIAVIAVTGGAVITASSIGESDTRPALPGEIEVGGGGAIAFTRFSIDGGIYRMAPDGSGVTKIIDDSRSEVDDPAWSPDGTKIAFHGYFDGARARTEGAIYVTDADGSNRTTVAIGSVSPSWGPNNDEVVFSALFEPSPGLTQGGIFRNDAHGEPLGLISRDKPNALDVSPDGRKIVFSLDGLYVVGIDSGQTDKILTPSDTFHHPTDPQWSPDGAHIAFTTPADQEGHTTVDVIDADGSNRRTITDGSSPTWSPDGTRIAFERVEGEVSHIYSIAIDGSDLQQLTFGPDSDHSPDWGAAPTDATPEPPDCPAVGEGGYQMTLEPPNPSPGTQVSATGPIPMYGEDGSYSPPGADEAVHFWLDADEKRWEDLIEPGLQPDKDPGEGARYLGSQSLADPTLCAFEFYFDMPDVPPGQHSVVAVMFGGGGAALYDAVPTSDADDLVKQLNDVGVACDPVENADDSEKRMDDGNLAIPHEDAAICALNNGALLTVLVVNDAQRTFDRYFAESHGPGHQLYGTTWIMLVPTIAPEGVVETIRTELHAKG